MIVQWLIASYATNKTYATWNPSDKSALVSLSGGNLTATSTPVWWNSVRSTIGKSSGKWYWEIAFTWTDNIIGIGLSTASLINFAWWDADWRWLYNANWQKYVSGSGVAYTTAFSAWTIIWVALDMSAWTLELFKNNVSAWVAFSWLSWTFYAMASTNNSGTQTANFGASAMTYTAPSGFNQWLYN